MLQLLQIAPSNGMDIMFNLGDLITLGVIIVPAIIGYTRLQGKTKNNEDSISSLLDKQKDDVLHITNGKRAIKKDLIQMIEKESEVTKNRIDKTQERMEKLNDANQIEFKSINEKLNRILGLLEKA
jgi:alpha-mannosidase